MALQPLLVLYFFTFGSLLNFLVLAWKLIIAVQNFTHMVVQNEFYKNHDHKTYVVTKCQWRRHVQVSVQLK